jgi:AcrR family transcriptional regulator
MARKAKQSQGEEISRERWIDTARSALLREGVDAVRVNRLANKLGVTRGGFYWRFKNLDDLLDSLLADWRQRNSGPFLAALSGSGTPAERLRAAFQLWLEEREFDPDYDTAIRAWSRLSRKVANAVHEVDDQRIDALQKLFADAGYPEEEALVRARITYYHQIGYYAMGVRESRKRRNELMELYYRILSGFKNGKPDR